MKKLITLLAFAASFNVYALSEQKAIDMVNQYAELTTCSTEVLESLKYGPKGYVIIWDAAGCGGGSGGGSAMASVVQENAFYHDDIKITSTLELGRFVPENIHIKGDKLLFTELFHKNSDSNCCPTGKKEGEKQLPWISE